jgi:hypothetical protein
MSDNTIEVTQSGSSKPASVAADGFQAAKFATNRCILPIPQNLRGADLERAAAAAAGLSPKRAASAEFEPNTAYASAAGSDDHDRLVRDEEIRGSRHAATLDTSSRIVLPNTWSARDLIKLAGEKPPRPIIEGLMNEGDIMLLNGTEESFKSIMVVQCAEAIAIGRPFCGSGAFTVSAELASSKPRCMPP